MPKDYERPEYQSNVEKWERKHGLNLPAVRRNNDTGSRRRRDNDTAATIVRQEMENRTCDKCGKPIEYPAVFCTPCREDIHRRYRERNPE